MSRQDMKRVRPPGRSSGAGEGNPAGAAMAAVAIATSTRTPKIGGHVNSGNCHIDGRTAGEPAKADGRESSSGESSFLEVTGMNRLILVLLAALAVMAGVAG